jgi:hypothetical protein
MTQQPVFRTRTCIRCFKPFTPAATGRPRLTCGDRCRKAESRHRQRVATKRPARDSRWSDAERQVRRWEKRFEPIDDTIPINGALTRRRTFLVRLSMGQQMPWCRVCNRPFLEEEGVNMLYCSQDHAREAKEKAEILLRALNQWDGNYDPRVDVRVRLDLPIKTCKRCIKPFPAYQPKQIFCTPNCRKAHWRETHPKCPICRERYPRLRSNQQYCTPHCRDVAHNIAERQRRRTRPPEPPL